MAVNVYPRRNGGSTKPRFFIYWTRDGYHFTGCYNIQPGCPGFVLTAQDVTFDCDVDETSVYDGDQFETDIRILRDSGNWYLFMNDAAIGYWPANIFTSLADGADSLEWGGEIGYKKRNGDNFHTTTQMGNGHFPNEGFYRAAYFRLLKVVDNNGGDWNDVNRNLLIVSAKKPNCYNFQFGQPDTEDGTSFLYGGPGGPNCDQ